MALFDNCPFPINIQIYDYLNILSDKDKFVKICKISDLYEIYIDDLQLDFICKTYKISKIGNILENCLNLDVKQEYITSLINEYPNIFKQFINTDILIQIIHKKYSDLAILIINTFTEFINPSCTQNESEKTLLALSFKENLYKLADTLIKTYGDRCNFKFNNKYGFTTLMYACYNASAKKYDFSDFDQNVIIYMINTFDNNCMIDSIAQKGNTALKFACTNNLDKVINILIDKCRDKCRPQIINRGKTPLIRLCRRSQKNRITESNINLIHKFIDTFRLDCAPGHADNKGNTALILLCERKLENEAIKLIDVCKHDCAPFNINNNNETALMIAQKNGLVRVVNKLTETFIDDGILKLIC
jgi:ankyrin repeat protein